MSAQEEVDDELSCKEDWTLAMNYSLEIAERLGERGVHKQTAGRIIEPYIYVDWLATSTDWEYFFTLRNSEKAQPETRELARQMQEAYDLSRPKKLLDGEWHIPFGDSIDTSMINDTPLKVIVAIATARCARISYETHNGLRDPIDDLRLHDTLLTDGHFSPFEHVAHALNFPERVGNFKGWVQYRKIIELPISFEEYLEELYA